MLIYFTFHDGHFTNNYNFKKCVVSYFLDKVDSYKNI